MRAADGSDVVKITDFGMSKVPLRLPSLTAVHAHINCTTHMVECNNQRLQYADGTVCCPSQRRCQPATPIVAHFPTWRRRWHTSLLAQRLRTMVVPSTAGRSG
jgi:hypothetical protein